MSVKDYVIIVIKSFILTMIVMPLFVGFIHIFQFNFTFASFICRISGIPNDLSLTIMSAGFENNIIFIMTTIEMFLFFYLLNTITNSKVYNRLIY